MPRQFLSDTHDESKQNVGMYNYLPQPQQHYFAEEQETVEFHKVPN